MKENQNRTVQMEEGEKRRKSDDAIWEQRMELCQQFFAEVPMNLMKNKKAAYIITGQWAKKAFNEAKIYGEAVAVASSEDKTYSYIPDCSDLDIPEDADYVYICENNTIYGTKYKTLPNTKGHILVSDVSSCFLSEPIDVTKYGVVYGGVQKNIGPAGVVIASITESGIL